MRHFTVKKVTFLLLIGALSGCAADVSTMTNEQLTECTRKSAILKNEVACYEELENRNPVQPVQSPSAGVGFQMTENHYEFAGAGK